MNLAALNSTGRVDGIFEGGYQGWILSDIPNQLGERGEALHSPASVGREERQRDLLVQRVAVNMVDFCVLRRRIDRWDPGHVAVQKKYCVRVAGAAVGAETESFRCDVREGKAHVTSSCVVDTNAWDEVCQLDEYIRGASITA